ncbi:GGDEF domain-containing protein [Sulfurimonas sp.]|uniref:GGDEF domain-containing protein n=1 Tax=Sulfurimonas sp. TaxID=2022749 RepID=UPI0025D723AA|nr:GGDEF domain-containing protein [Sulfurimonas sp.]
MTKFWKNYNIPILLLSLVVSLSALSFFNYYTQKNLLLKRMESDAEDIASSITAAMNRFYDIKSTMRVQKLVSDISLGLEIFEFRYIETDGTVRNSMFKEEIGKAFKGKSFAQLLQGTVNSKEFIFETRDYVPVMAIYYPIKIDEKVIGIIDLAVDITEHKDVVSHGKIDFSLMRRQIDILNLLKAIEGSIHNSIEITSKTDFHDFLKKYVESAKNIVKISIVNQQRKVLISSNKSDIGKTLHIADFPPPEIVNLDKLPIYRLIKPSIGVDGNTKEQLLLLIDATVYAQNEERLLRTAMLTAVIAILFALFIARIIYYSAIERSREDKERLERLVKERTHEIELLSKTDALTGIWNRGYLEEMMDMKFKYARRYESTMAILVIDLDYFKKVNDTYGHLGGDEVLRQVSRCLSGCLRETDFIGRYGGEEIVVILSETTIEQTLEIANKLCSTVAAKPIKFGEMLIPVTVSIGVSIIRNEHEHYEDIFSEADEALYVSKSNGRNRVSLYGQ